jgi:recombinational DNA repair protein RecR
VIRGLGVAIRLLGQWVADLGFALEHLGRCYFCGDFTTRKVCDACRRSGYTLGGGR